jgi:hypothetical protein
MLHLHRRGLEQASEVAAVMDGAEWLQEVVASHRADAVRMLDVAHAAEEVSALGEAVHQAGDALPGWWLEAVLHRLTHEGPERILRQVSRLGRRCNDPDVGKKLQEVFQRRSQIQSPTSQAAGWPIGLSIVERANTLVVVARFTGAGRQWKRENVKCDLQ